MKNGNTRYGHNYTESGECDGRARKINKRRNIRTGRRDGKNECKAE